MNPLLMKEQPMDSKKKQYLSMALISYPFVNANTKGENGLQFLNTDTGSFSTINGVTFARAIRDAMATQEGVRLFRHSDATDSMSKYGYGSKNSKSMASAAEDLVDPDSKSYSQFLFDDTPHRGVFIAESTEASGSRVLTPEQEAESAALKTVKDNIKKIKKAQGASKDDAEKANLQSQIDELDTKRKDLEAKVKLHPKGEKLEPVAIRGLTQVSVGISATPYPDDEPVFVRGTKANGDSVPFTYMRHFTRYVHYQTMDVKNLMRRSSCIKAWLQALHGLQLGGGHTSNLSEFVPEVIVWRFHDAPGQGGLFLTPEDTKGWTHDAKVDLAPLYRKLANLGITDVNVGGLEVLRDGVPIPGTKPVSECLDQIYDEIVRMWGV